MAFLLCVVFCDYGVLRELGCGVDCSLTGLCAKEAICHIQ